MNKNYSRFAMALVATTSLVGVTQLADAGTLFLDPVPDNNKTAMQTEASHAGTSAQVSFAVDIFGSSGVAIGVAGVQNSFDLGFQLANAVAANDQRLLTLTLSLGTFADGGTTAAFATGVTGIIDAAGTGAGALGSGTVTKIGGGITTDNVLFTVDSTDGISAGEFVATEFQIAGLTAMATANTEITISAELTLPSGQSLETDSIKVAKSVTGANTTISTGKTVTINADDAFKSLLKQGGAPNNTSTAVLGTIQLKNSGTTAGLDAAGAAFSTFAILDATGSYTITVAMPSGAATSVTSMCMDTDPAATVTDCGTLGTNVLAGAKAINGKRDTNPGTTEFIWSFGVDANDEGTVSTNFSALSTILAVIDGTSVIDPGTFTITVDGSYGNVNFVAFPADVATTTFSVWALGGLSASLGPVLANSSTHLSVIRVTNLSATPGNVTVTVRDQTTGATKGTADSLLVSGLASGAAAQVVIGDILSAVGYTPSGVSAVIVDVRCTCSGNAAVLMLNPDGGFSNVGFTQN